MESIIREIEIEQEFQEMVKEIAADIAESEFCETLDTLLR